MAERRENNMKTEPASRPKSDQSVDIKAPLEVQGSEKSRNYAQIF